MAEKKDRPTVECSRNGLLIVKGPEKFSNSPGKLDKALERAFAHDGPALVEVLTDPELI